MNLFDKSEILEAFQELEPEALTFFGLACATRLANSLQSFTSDHTVLRAIDSSLDELWATFVSGDLDREFRIFEEVEEILERVTELNEGEFNFVNCLVEDASAAIIYCRLSLMEDEHENAVFSAGRNHDTIDQFLSQSINEYEFSADYEKWAREHPLMRTEQERRERDFKLVSEGGELLAAKRQSLFEIVKPETAIRPM